MLPYIQKEKKIGSFQKNDNHNTQKIIQIIYVLLLNIITNTIFATEIPLDVYEQYTIAKPYLSCALKEPFHPFRLVEHQKSPITKGSHIRNALHKMRRIVHNVLHSESETSSCIHWFGGKKAAASVTSVSETHDYENKNIVSNDTQKQSIDLTLILSTDITILITHFLDYPEQLRLSQVNKGFRRVIDERFWTRQIKNQEYLLWDTTLPKAHIFFANYYYHQGFGRKPKLPEKMVLKAEDVTDLPNLTFAKKALKLGFPKGHENYREVLHVKHKKSKPYSSCEDYMFASTYQRTFFSSYESSL